MKTLRLLLPFVFAMFLYACSGSVGKVDNDYLVVKLNGSNLWSIVDVQTGELICENEFKNLPSIVRGELFYTMNKYKNEFDLFSIKNPRIPMNKEPYVSVAFCENNMAFTVKKGSGISIVNNKGIEKVSLPADIKRCYWDLVNDGIFLYSDRDSKYGYADINGNILLRARYKEATPYNEYGYAIVIEYDNNERLYSIIDKKGNVVFSFSGYPIEFMKDKLLVAEDNEVCLLDIKQGKTVLQVGRTNKYFYRGAMFDSDYLIRCLHDFHFSNGKYIVYSDGRLMGLKNSRGDVIIRPKFSILQFYRGYLVAIDDEKLNIINNEGDVISPFQDKSIDKFRICSDDRFIDNGGLIDKKGKDVGVVTFSTLNEEVFSRFAESDLSEEAINKTYTNFVVKKEYALQQQTQEAQSSNADDYEDADDYEGDGDRTLDYLDKAPGDDLWLSKNKLTENDIKNFRKWELEILRNSIFASHGYKFKRTDLFETFSNTNWYHPSTSDMAEVLKSLNDIELYNIEFLKAHEKSL